MGPSTGLPYGLPIGHALAVSCEDEIEHYKQFALARRCP